MRSTVIRVLWGGSATVVRSAVTGKLLVPRNKSLLEHECEDDQYGEHGAEADQDGSLASLTSVASGASFGTDLRTRHAAAMLGTCGSGSVS